MAFDSLQWLCALALFAAGIGAWWMTGSRPACARLYLRFAAILFAAIAVSVPFGISDDVALFLLPLASACLMIAALPPLPVLLASFVLVANLICGISAMLWNLPMPALSLAMLAGMALIAASLHGTAMLAGLAGMALLASSLVLLEQGAGNGFLLLAAAALIGLAKPTAQKSALAIQQ